MQLVKSGKVREIYGWDEEHLLIVATDRLSAYDVIFPDPFPGKGVVLTALSKWWFGQIASLVDHHYRPDKEEELKTLSAAAKKVLPPLDHIPQRSMIVHKCEVIPYECIVRGFAFGSYLKKHPDVAPLTPFPEPLFTPTTKAEEGHDQRVSFEEMAQDLGELAYQIRNLSLEIFDYAQNICRKGGLRLVDTKFEFGLDKEGGIRIIDEVLTPDSSRYLLEEDIERGIYSPYDKQLVRNYVDDQGWNREAPAPAVPAEIMEKTMERYHTTYRRLTGDKLEI